MLGHIPSSGRNPRGSPDFSAYPVPNACMHVLGTGVPRRLGVARSASSPKAALALGCSSLAGSPAWHRLPQCPGYGHWVSYCCVACVFGSGLCLGSGVGCAPPLLAGVLGCVCACVCTPLVRRMASPQPRTPGHRTPLPGPPDQRSHHERGSDTGPAPTPHQTHGKPHGSSSTPPARSGPQSSSPNGTPQTPPANTRGTTHRPHRQGTHAASHPLPCRA